MTAPTAATASTSGLDDLPAGIDLVWHGVNDPLNLRQFLGSPVRWAELDVNLDPRTNSLILRHDTLGERPAAPGEAWLDLAPTLRTLHGAGKYVKLDFKLGDPWLEPALTLLEETGFTGDRVWLNGELDLLGEDWLRRMADQWPGAVIQVPVHFLRGYEQRLDAAHPLLARCADAGVNRFSVPFTYPGVKHLLDRMRRWGYTFNLYGIAAVPSLLAAAAEQPASITADFNFPEWGYYGRGSGHEGRYWEYCLVAAPKGDG